MRHTTFILFIFVFSAATSQLSHSQEIKIASWNISWLGSHDYNKRSKSDYLKLARYAKTLNADVIALQEVENDVWAKKVFGEDYRYFFSTKDWVQRVGVAIKKSSGLRLDAKEYQALDVGNTRYGLDVTLTRHKHRLRLLIVHLKSGCFSLPLDPKSVNRMLNKTQKQQRKKEACTKLSLQVKPLKQWIDSSSTKGIPYIVLGDFNRRFAQDIKLQRTKTQGLWQALNNGENHALWTPTTSRNSRCWGGYYKDYIDHILFSPKAKNKLVKGSFSQLVFKAKYAKKRAQRLSDHCPISVKINF